MSYTGKLTVLVQASGATIEALLNSVNALGLPGGTQMSLQAKLGAAAAAKARGDKKTAVNQLNAFINEIEALKKSRRLSAAQADALIAQTRQVIAALSTP